MIVVHRLRGEELVVNADLIEMVEERGDTIITLIDGQQFIVAETPEQVATAVLQHRAAQLAAAAEIRGHLGSVLDFPG